MVSVNKKIIDYIRENKISQSDIAKKTGIAQSNLNRLLNSDDLRVSHLIQITKALELPVTYFFDGKEHISNEEIEGYKKRINELEYFMSIAKRHEEEKLFIAFSQILDVEFKNIKKETKKVLISQLSEDINSMKEFRDHFSVIHINDFSKEVIIDLIKKMIKEIEKKKP